MKIYKYRDINSSNDCAFSRLSEILRKNEFWCASPAKLNDPDEFTWECDGTPTIRTEVILVELLVKSRGHDSVTALALASDAISRGRINTYVRSLVQDIIHKTRDELGVACFGTSPDNLVLWQRYGGNGAGVCIEIDVPDNLLDDQLHRVEYLDAKKIHFDHLLKSMMDDANSREIYSMSLCAKGAAWAEEQEVRLISKSQNVGVQISGSCISRLILGPCLDMTTTERLRKIVASLSYKLLVETSCLTITQ